MKMFLVLAFVFLLIPASLAFAQVDPEEILATHLISNKAGDYIITNDYQIEFSKLGGMYMIHGHVTTGDPYAIYLKSFDPNFKMVFFYKDGVYQKSTLKEIIVATVEKNTQTPILEKIKPVLDFNYFISNPILIQRDFSVKLNAFDIQNTTSNYQNIGKMKDIKFHVELAQERTESVFVNELTIHKKILENEWKTIKSIDGITNREGVWSGSVFLTSGTLDADQRIRVTMTGTFGDQVVKKETIVYATNFHY